MGFRLLRFPAVQDGLQCVALPFVRSLVDNRLHLPSAFEDRTRPGIDQRRIQAGEIDVPEISFVDSQHFETAALAVSGQ